MGGAFGSAGAQGTGGTTTTISGRQLSQGPAKLVDVFVGEKGTYIVLADALALVDPTGQELKRTTAPREITAAAFDGSRLVVADRAKLTVYDPDLGAGVSSDLAESCASAVLVSQGRFVCGPSNDWDRAFYTYDTSTGALLATSKLYTYNGIPMRRVPGTDDFVTVTTDSSPSDFHLYSVTATHEAVYVNESPYHGDFRVTDVYAFNGEPPTHLVTDEGLLLRIYGQDCSAGQSSFTSQCFVKDGVLGTLSGAQVFLGMDSSQTGKLYGVVDPTPGTFDAPCDTGCIAQRADLKSRTIEAQKIVQLDIGKIIALRRATESSFVVGYRVSGRFYVPSDPYPGHRVVLIDLN